jgi:DNA-binding transcriptional MocR family regulator
LYDYVPGGFEVSMLVEDIVRTIKADIAKRKIKPKEKLPSERTLQEVLGSVGGQSERLQEFWKVWDL